MLYRCTWLAAPMAVRLLNASKRFSLTTARAVPRSQGNSLVERAELLQGNCLLGSSWNFSQRVLAQLGTTKDQNRKQKQPFICAPSPSSSDNCLAPACPTW